MIRLWLACADDVPLPQSLRRDFQGLTPEGRPNGIEVPGVPRIAPLDAG